MNAPSPTSNPPMPLSLAFRRPESDQARARHGLDGLRQLARAERALRLRQAMLLAWIKREDPMDLGYSTFSAFLAERAEIGDSYARGLIRLVESPLDVIKWAACVGLVPLREAVRAPGLVAVGEQWAWIAEVAFSDDEVPPASVPREGVLLRGDDAHAVHRARRVARLLMGRRASDRQVDDQVVAWFRDQVPGEALLAGAREAPPPPSWDRPLTWDWLPPEGPAADLLGPWRVPTSLAEAAARLEELQAASRGRQVVIARAWAEIKRARSYEAAGYPTAGAFVRDVLGVSPRTAARYLRLGEALEAHPELVEAVREGLDLGRADFLSRVLGEGSARTWIQIAKRVGLQELRELQGPRGPLPGARGRYEQALLLARRWEAEREATSVGGPSEVQDPLRVSLPSAAPVEGGVRPVRVRAVVVEASRWLLEQVPLARESKRKRWVCENPECRRRTLRVHRHHIHWRSRGGSDAEENLATLCVPCHLRGVHTGRIGMERVDVFGHDAILWTYPGGRRVLAFR